MEGVASTVRPQTYQHQGRPNTSYKAVVTHHLENPGLPGLPAPTRSNEHMTNSRPRPRRVYPNAKAIAYTGTQTDQVTRDSTRTLEKPLSNLPLANTSQSNVCLQTLFSHGNQTTLWFQPSSQIVERKRKASCSGMVC